MSTQVSWPLSQRSLQPLSSQCSLHPLQAWQSTGCSTGLSAAENKVSWEGHSKYGVLPAPRQPGCPSCVADILSCPHLQSSLYPCRAEQ